METPTPRITFHGTANPRELRAITALLKGELKREQLDRIAGCSNAPHLVSRLRALGLGFAGLPCRMENILDRDGASVRCGVYALSAAGRRAVNKWMRSRAKVPS